MTDQELDKIEYAHLRGERGGDRASALEHRGLLIEALKAERAQRALFEESSQEAQQLVEEREECWEAMQAVVEAARDYRAAEKGSKAKARAYRRLMDIDLPEEAS